MGYLYLLPLSAGVLFSPPFVYPSVCLFDNGMTEKVIDGFCVGLLKKFFGWFVCEFVRLFTCQIHFAVMYT